MRKLTTDNHSRQWSDPADEDEAVMRKMNCDSETQRILWGFPAKSPAAHVNLQIVLLEMLDHRIWMNKVKFDGGPEWPTLKETRADISLSNPHYLKMPSSTPTVAAAQIIQINNNNDI